MSAWFAYPALGLTTNAAGLVDYVPFQGDSYVLRPWIGTNVAILTPDNGAYGTNVMARIIESLDRAYQLYSVATGHAPYAWNPTTLYGRDAIAVVPTTCGAGCGHLGRNGIEILTSHFHTFYNGVQANNEYDQVLFYELGRNFWFYGSQLAYHSPDSDPVVTGYAVYMRFMAMDAAGVQGGPFHGHSFETFRTTVTNLMDSYIADSALNWSNTFRLAQAPANPLELGGADLIASMLMRIERDFGGPTFITNFWRQAGLRPAASSTQTAVDNFVLAACATVNQNLCGIFTNNWKLPVSPSALQEAQTRWGSQILVRPELQRSGRPDDCSSAD